MADGIGQLDIIILVFNQTSSSFSSKFNWKQCMPEGLGVMEVRGLVALSKQHSEIRPIKTAFKCMLIKQIY